MRYCKDCRFATRERNPWILLIPLLGWLLWLLEADWKYAKCKKFERKSSDHFTQPMKTELSYCSTVREGECGADAKLFEPR